MNPGWMAGLAATMGLPLALAGPADPGAPAPAPLYRPVFGAPAPDTSPLDWREANDTVGRFARGHADLLREENPPPAQPPAPIGETLSLEQALTLAWARDPGHFTTPGMSAAEVSATQARAARQAHTVRRAWYTAVAAEARRLEEEKRWEAADTGAELGRRMQRVGTWSTTQAAHERQQRLEAGAALVRARTEALMARERLNVALGTWHDNRSDVLPMELPPLPAQLQSPDGLEAQALERHPALRSLRAEQARQTAAVSGEARAQARAALRAATPTLSLDTRALPGWNHALEQALETEARTDTLALQIRSQVRQAWLNLRATHEIATQARGEALALASQLQQDSQQRYNGMLASTWELLAASRALGAARTTAIQATLDFWLAHNDLTATLAGATEPADTP